MCSRCVKSTRKPGNYSVERKLWALVDRGCYGDVTTLVDKY